MRSNEKSLIQSFYEKHHLTGNRLQQSFLEKERGALFSKWIGKNKKVLDLGGRDGTLTRYFCNNNKVTIGDIDEKALSYAKDNYDVETEIINLNETLPFPDNSFDYVVMAEVLEHLPYPMITLGEIKRVLKKDGQLIGNLPLAYHLKDRIQILRGRKLMISGDPTHLQFLSYQDVTKLLSVFFIIKKIEVLKGGKKKSAMFPRLFARNIAFICSLNQSKI
jgi:ubiquinone/menaquinone biosynthesis C-methylase UbiE